MFFPCPPPLQRELTEFCCMLKESNPRDRTKMQGGLGLYCTEEAGERSSSEVLHPILISSDFQQ